MKKYNVNLKIETNSGIVNDIYTVRASNPKTAENVAATQAMDNLGRDNVIEITVREVLPYAG